MTDSPVPVDALPALIAAPVEGYCDPVSGVCYLPGPTEEATGDEDAEG